MVIQHRKSEHADAAEVQLKAKLFRGLADPSRLSILEALRGGPRNVSMLVKMTGLSQPNTSMHLNCLWCCGLVDKEVRGRRSIYRVRSGGIEKVLEAAEDILDEVRERIAECRRYEQQR